MICCFAMRMSCHIWYVLLWYCNMRYHVAPVYVFLLKCVFIQSDIIVYRISHVACSTLHWCKTPLISEVYCICKKSVKVAFSSREVEHCTCQCFHVGSNSNMPVLTGGPCTSVIKIKLLPVLPTHFFSVAPINVIFRWNVKSSQFAVNPRKVLENFCVASINAVAFAFYWRHLTLSQTSERHDAKKRHISDVLTWVEIIQEQLLLLLLLLFQKINSRKLY